MMFGGGFCWSWTSKPGSLFLGDDRRQWGSGGAASYMEACGYNHKMGMELDFRKVVIKDVNGQEQEVNLQKELGNQLYMGGRDIEECELGSRIYHDGCVDVDAKGESAIRRVVSGWPFVLRSGVLSLMEAKEDRGSASVY